MTTADDLNQKSPSRLPLDTAFVRAQFPANIWKTAFFENAGGVFVPQVVIDRMTSYMSETQIQPGYPSSPSTLAAQRMAEGHRLMAEMIGADEDEVTVTASTSINVYVLAQALRHLWQEGDEIIVSIANHEANSGPWRRLAEFGMVIREWPVLADTGELDIGALDELLNDRTRLVVFPQVSNVAGGINDVPAITEKVHSAGALVCVDGVAYAPHRAIDVKAWDVDFYLFSFYKIFGPHLGCLYGKRELLLKAKGQYHYFFSEDDLPHKFNPAGPNHESISALAGIAEYFDNLSEYHFSDPAESFFQRTQDLYALIADHEEILAAKFLDFINSKNSIRLLGINDSDQNRRVATFSIQVANKKSADITALVAKDNVAIGSGHFYAPRLIEAMGVDDCEDGVVRCSMAHYNTLGEVDQLIRSLDKLI